MILHQSQHEWSWVFGECEFVCSAHYHHRRAGDSDLPHSQNPKQFSLFRRQQGEEKEKDVYLDIGEKYV